MYNLHQLFGSNCHRIHQFGKGSRIFQDQIDTYKDLINALKQDRYTLVKE